MALFRRVLLPMVPIPVLAFVVAVLRGATLGDGETTTDGPIFGTEVFFVAAVFVGSCVGKEVLFTLSPQAGPAFSVELFCGVTAFFFLDVAVPVAVVVVVDGEFVFFTCVVVMPVDVLVDDVVLGSLFAKKNNSWAAVSSPKWSRNRSYGS